MQFGLPYGVANRAGQVSQEEAGAIVRRAHEAGVDTLDTAIAYGSSEACLGQIGVAGWRVVTKLPAVPAGCDVSEWVRDSVAESLRRLGLARVAGVLLHRSEELLAPYGPELYASLAALKTEGTVAAVGVSIYAPRELDPLWARYPLDIVQAPFSVFDRRLAESGWLSRLHAAGVEVHTRSAFLQGLLLMAPERRPPSFRRWQRALDGWDRWLAESGLSPLEACLRFVFARPEIARVIVGVDGLSQLEDILSVDETRPLRAPEWLASTDLELIDPSQWKLP